MIKLTYKPLLVSALWVLSAAAYATDAPQVSLESNQVTFVWPQVDAVSINVHRSNGEWLSSIPGDATRWEPDSPDGYFLVATDMGPWESWGKSVTLNVSEEAWAQANALSQSNDDSNQNDASPIESDIFLLSAQVYSQSAIEIFWTNHRDVDRVQIVRSDGATSSTNGRSFFDDSLTPATSYTYTLTPMDVRGNPGTVRLVEVMTTGPNSLGSLSVNPQITPPPLIDANPAPAPVATISSDSYRGIVKQALEVFSGQAFDDRLTLFPYFLGGFGGNNLDLVFACDNGGTYSRHFFGTNFDREDVMDASYNNCLWGSEMTTTDGTLTANSIDGLENLVSGGRVNGRIDSHRTPGGHFMSFTNFSDRINNDDIALMQVDGQYNPRFGSHETIDLDYFFTFPEGALRVTDATTLLARQHFNDLEGSMVGGFIMQRDEDNLADIQVQTDIPFTWDPQTIEATQGSQRYRWKFTEGVLRLTAPGDGSSVTVNANTGDFNTVTVTLSNASESRIFVENWGDWEDALYCKTGFCESYAPPGVPERTLPAYR